MTGDILAAHAEDDVYHLLRRLVARGALTQPNADTIEDKLSDGERSVAELTSDLVDHLFEEVENELLLEVLFDRFKENISQFLVAHGPAHFDSMEAVFVSNLQIGHDTPALLEELRATVERSGALLAAQVQSQSLVPGPNPARQPAEETLIRVVGERLNLADLLHRSPYEPFDTLELVVDMLAGGLLVADGAPPVQEPDELTPEALSDADLTSEAEPIEGDPSDILETAPQEMGWVPIEEPEPDPTGPSEVGAPRADEPVQPLDMAGFTAGPEQSVFDQELAAFGDYDTYRGAEGDGHFIKTLEELDADRVDLRDIFTPLEPMTAAPSEESNGLLVADEEEVLEAPDAEGIDLSGAPLAQVSMSFTGPRLTNDEARNKIGVVNEVLREVSRSFDSMRGSGYGQSQVQLLLDGCPAGFSVLFQQIDASDNGTVSGNALLGNLRRRPSPEHRTLLNKGLHDLINRALSSAVENLDDEHIDDLLQNIVGYQQRLGP